MQEISEMVSRPRHLGAGGFPRFYWLAEACVPLRTARPLLKKTSTDVPGRQWTAFTNFLKKPYKSIRQEAA